jgi:hypothetical protein
MARFSLQGIPVVMNSDWGDQCFFDSDDSREIRGASCRVGNPQGVLVDSTVDE